MLLVYKNVTGFCMLTLHPVSLVNSFIISGRFLKIKKFFLHGKPCHRPIETVLFLIFQHMCFTRFSCLFAIAVLFSIVYCSIEVSEWTSLVCCYIRESIQSFTIKYNVNYRFFIDALYQLEDFPVYSFSHRFIINESWVLSNAVLHLLRQSCGFSSSVLDMANYVAWFSDAKLALHSQDKLYLVTMYYPFY